MGNDTTVVVGKNYDRFIFYLGIKDSFARSVEIITVSKRDHLKVRIECTTTPQTRKSESLLTYTIGYFEL